MNRQKSIQMSKNILTEFKIPETKENIDNLLKILKDYSILKEDKFADYECEGQMDINDFLDTETEMEM